MSFQELGITTKPQTKYFDGGYVSFSSLGKTLYYRLTLVSKTKQFLLIGGVVRNKEYFEKLLAIKTSKDAVELT